MYDAVNVDVSLNSNRWINQENLLWFSNKLLTKSSLYFFDSFVIMNRLSQTLTRSIILSLSIDRFLLTCTSIIHEEIIKSLTLLNLYTSFYKIKLRRLTKIMHDLRADLLVAHDFTRKLFKTNQTRKSRKKTQKKWTTSLSNECWLKSRRLVVAKKRRIKSRIWDEKSWTAKRKSSLSSKRSRRMKSLDRWFDRRNERQRRKKNK